MTTTSKDTHETLTIDEITSILYATDPATHGDDNKIWFYDRDWVSKHFCLIDEVCLHTRRHTIGRSCEDLRELRGSFKPTAKLDFFKVKKGNSTTEFIRIDLTNSKN